MVNHSGVHPNLRTICRRIGDRVHLLLVATTDVNPNEEFFFDYGVRSDDEDSRLSFLMTTKFGHAIPKATSFSVSGTKLGAATIYVHSGLCLINIFISMALRYRGKRVKPIPK